MNDEEQYKYLFHWIFEKNLSEKDDSFSWFSDYYDALLRNEKMKVFLEHFFAKEKIKSELKKNFANKLF